MKAAVFNFRDLSRLWRVRPRDNEEIQEALELMGLHVQYQLTTETSLSYTARYYVASDGSMLKEYSMYAFYSMSFPMFTVPPFPHISVNHHVRHALQKP